MRIRLGTVASQIKSNAVTLALADLDLDLRSAQLPCLHARNIGQGWAESQMQLQCPVPFGKPATQRRANYLATISRRSTFVLLRPARASAWRSPTPGVPVSGPADPFLDQQQAEQADGRCVGEGK